MPQRSGRVSSFYGKPFCPFFCILLRTAAYMVDIAQLVRVSGCGPEGRRFEPGYPPHLFRSVPRPFTCRAADIAEGRRIFYVPAFAFTLPFCLLRVFAFFLTLPAFSVSLCAALRVLPCLRSLLHSLRASCAFRPKPAFFVRFALFNRGSFAFCAPFCSVRLSSFLRAFCDCAFSFSLSWLSPPLPRRRLRAVLRFFRRGNGRCRIDFIVGVWLSW